MIRSQGNGVFYVMRTVSPYQCLKTTGPQDASADQALPLPDALHSYISSTLVSKVVTASQNSHAPRSRKPSETQRSRVRRRYALLNTVTSTKIITLPWAAERKMSL